MAEGQPTNKAGAAGVLSLWLEQVRYALTHYLCAFAAQRAMSQVRFPDLSCEFAAVDSVDMIGDRRHDLSGSAVYKCVPAAQLSISRCSSYRVWLMRGMRSLLIR